MSIKSNLIRAGALGAALTALTAGAAFAAVATSSVNVRSGPGTGYSVVDVLEPGQPVSIEGRSGGWCAVSKAGPNGWVSCNYLSGASFDGPRRFNQAPSVTLQFGMGYPDYYYPRHRRMMPPPPLPGHHIGPHPYWW